MRGTNDQLGCVRLVFGADFAHPDAIAFGVVLGLAHEFADQQHAATSGLIEAILFGWIGDIFVVEPIPLVGDGHFGGVMVDEKHDVHFFGRVLFVAVFDCVDDGFFDGHLDVEYITTFPAGRFKGAHQFFDRCVPCIQFTRDDFIAFPHWSRDVHQQWSWVRGPDLEFEGSQPGGFVLSDVEHAIKSRDFEDFADFGA